VVVEVLLLVAVVRDVWLELLLVELKVLVVILMVSILRVEVRLSLARELVLVHDPHVFSVVGWAGVDRMF